VNFQAGYYFPTEDAGNGGYPNQNANFWVALQESHARLYCEWFKELWPGREMHTAVQAGGNVGMFPKMFAQYFKKVLTFEPDPLNWPCLLRNLEGYSNVTACHKALGATHRVATIEHNGLNCGASYVTPDNEIPKKGEYSACDVMPLDWLQLLSLDLLQLDVEGYEIEALEGAVDHIQRQRPLIILESNECAARYGRSHKDLVTVMKNLGYKQWRTNGNDIALHHREGA
jgi:FkbM family methyltransferase